MPGPLGDTSLEVSLDIAMFGTEQILPRLTTGGSRPSWSRHYTERRVRGHVFLCMLAAYLVWHLRTAWAPLTFTDQTPPTPTDPVAPARRSAAAERKAATQQTDDELPARSFGDLLSHLATLSRNDMHVAGTPHDQTFQLLAVPTHTQHRAFDLIHTPIPLQLR